MRRLLKPTTWGGSEAGMRAQVDSLVDVAGTLAAQCRAVREPGGWELIGRWQFASGVDHGDWLLIGAIADELRENDFPGLRLIVAKSDIEVDDTWHTLVLRGSGSKMLLLMACSCHHIGRCRVALSSTVLANMVRHTALTSIACRCWFGCRVIGCRRHRYRRSRTLAAHRAHCGSPRGVHPFVEGEECRVTDACRRSCCRAQNCAAAGPGGR